MNKKRQKQRIKAFFLVYLLNKREKNSRNHIKSITKNVDLEINNPQYNF